jgi:hypothetical protein
MKIRKLSTLVLAGAVCAFFCLGNVQAVTLALNGPTGSDLITTGGALSVGTIINGTQAGGQVDRDVDMTNNLRTLGLGAFNSSFGDGNEYHRSLVPASLPVATAVGAIATSAGGLAFGTNISGAIVSITLGSTFQYLVAAYDGPNGGVMVYNIASLPVGTVIQIPRYAQPSGAAGSQSLISDDGTYQMTGWTLINPNPPQQQPVPDSGATVILLGAALTGLGAMRRFLKN